MARTSGKSKTTTHKAGSGWTPIEVSVPTRTSPIATTEVTLTDTPTGAVAVQPQES